MKIKKALNPFYHKEFLIENGCKTLIGRLTFIFCRNFFYDKMELRFFLSCCDDIEIGSHQNDLKQFSK